MNEKNNPVSLEKQNEVALIRIDNPPVNALGIAVRQGLMDSINALAADDALKAAIIICEGRTFCAGADIKEFGRPPEDPWLPQVLDAIEACPKPVIAAMHGTALGGGLETAMACHFRVALASARMGLPEVKLGLLPGAGGTQRLPRLVGVEKALEMITSGTPVDAKQAKDIGLVDEIVDNDLEAGALAFARKIFDENRPVMATRDIETRLAPARETPGIFDEFRKSIARRTRGFEAPEACIKAVEACVTMPFEAGAKFERTLFQELMAGTQSAAQRYYFFAERQAAKVPDINKETPRLTINNVAIIGAGTMGGGIAMNFANAGLSVIVVEANPENLDRGLGIIRKNYDASAAKGKLSQTDVDDRMNRITGTVSMDDVKDADLVVEAVFENMDLKKEIFTRLDNLCKDNAILATNTSYLDINEIAAVTRRPESVLGLHFFSPANVMRLLEIVRAEKTAQAVLATCLDLARTIRKLPVVVGVCHGFAGNRMFARRKEEADALILEGADPEQVDKVLYDFGFPMGPFALYDLIGLDLGWQRETSTGATVKERLCEMGRFGQKSGAGFYKYEPGSRKPIPDPDVRQLIRDLAAEKNIARRDIADGEILERCLYPVINEGAKILEEGIATRPSDLDVIWVNGYGWPVYRGGPMFYADTVGLDNMLSTLKKYAPDRGEAWKPSALLEKLVAEGKRFQDMGDTR
ncbi:MAG: 3-hydroxyacyl-CoA dehydrogenase NAD-binding domain-containing protein [Thermodesulfobacteriota bacterium]|nr:3-hydroxyacyl-CoA dehydrogenase NAD-binding domain-containing protein [Thermodesulfobacteriota bacterium]